MCLNYKNFETNYRGKINNKKKNQTTRVESLNFFPGTVYYISGKRYKKTRCGGQN